jgi:hypothetical protein
MGNVLAVMRIRALREGQTRREAGAQSLRASYVWEVAGLPNRAVGPQSSAIREGGSGCGPVLEATSTLLRGAKLAFFFQTLNAFSDGP